MRGRKRRKRRWERKKIRRWIESGIADGKGSEKKGKERKRRMGTIWRRKI